MPYPAGELIIEPPTSLNLASGSLAYGLSLVYHHMQLFHLLPWNGILFSASSSKAHFVRPGL